MVIWGPSKSGKTTATGAIGASGHFLAHEGGLLPLKCFLGLDKVSFETPKDVPHAAAIMRKRAGKVPTIVVDDFSLMVEQTVAQLESKHSFGEMWRNLRKHVLDMRDAARSATHEGTHVIFNCHASPPRTSSGRYVRGGPQMPGQLPEQFSAFADIVAKVEFEATAAPWKYLLRTGPSPEYISGDRLAIFPDPAPMNLAEALRLSGYDLPRPKGLEWQENVVSKLCEKICAEGIAEWRDILRPAAQKLRSKYSIPHVRWALQDSLHRAILMNAQDSIDGMFSDSGEEW